MMLCEHGFDTAIVYCGVCKPNYRRQLEDAPVNITKDDKPKGMIDLIESDTKQAGIGNSTSEPIDIQWELALMWKESTEAGQFASADVLKRASNEITRLRESK